MQSLFCDKKTPIHRLHSLCKLLWVCGVFLGSLVLNDPVLLLVLFLSTIPFFVVGQIVHEWFVFLQFALYFSLLIFLINSLVSQHGSTILFQSPWSSYSFSITLESVVFSVMMCLRLFATISAFALLTLTVDSDSLLNTFRLLRFPEKTVFTTSLSLRFMPLLFHDLELLQQSLQTRGYSLQHSKRFFTRIRRQMILVIPLLTNALDRAIQSAEAMEARGFGSSGKKTVFNKKKITTVDVFLLVVSSFGIVFFFLLFIFDVSSFSVYPTVSSIQFSFSYLVLVFGVLVVVTLPILFSPLKRMIEYDSI
ncbi:MAG: energy-coupling factor transporter transmembrane component T [Candidatus Thermoplasmatota archaeon]